jgi:amidohydrolase
MPLSAETLGFSEEIRDLRRALHRIPEKGLEEFATQRFILEYLKSAGVAAEPIAATGVKAVIRGALPGPVTALRADMDALNVDEPVGCGFESENPGWMHACGHDGHMAMLLAAAKLLRENGKRVKGAAVLLFQPCEEIVKGARMMVEAGALENPKADRIFALHLMPHIQEGKIGIVSGPAMAAACEFAITMEGRSAHGAMPHLGVDAAAAAAHFVCGAQAVISRCKPPEAPGLMTIGRIEAGKRHNIIADRAFMEGTLRCYDGALMRSMRERLLAHLRGAEEAWGVKAGFREISAVPAVVNDAGLAGLAFEAFPEACVKAEPLMVAEDFCRYCERVPGLMGFLGCRDEAKGYTEPLHTPGFAFDENALLWGLEFYTRLLVSR